MTLIQKISCFTGGVLVSFIVGMFSGGIVEFLSPEFHKSFFNPTWISSLRYATEVRLIWGVFIGAGIIGFSMGLVTLVQIAIDLTKRK